MWKQHVCMLTHHNAALSLQGGIISSLTQQVSGKGSHCRKCLHFCSYDVVLTAGKEEILEKFQKFKARVVFSAEGFCWPDPSLAVGVDHEKFDSKTVTCLSLAD